MRIAVCDNNGGKFTNDIINHWKNKGHEVRFEPGASEHLAQWAELYFCEEFDNNIHYLWKLYNDDPDHNRTTDWDNNKKPKFFARPLDWTVWMGLARDQRIIDWIDGAICIAPHIEKKLREDNNWKDKLHLIRPGVNLDKFTLKTTKTDSFQLGMVLGDMWFPKQHMMGLDIFIRLYEKDSRWRLHIRGQHEGGNEFWKKMYDHYLESRNIENVVTLYSSQPDMNAWYEQIDILLHPGMKEAFSYAVGEASAKGIPVVVNNFYGAEDIWDKNWLYNNSEEAVNMILAMNKTLKEGNTEIVAINAREAIKSHYPLEKMIIDFDELLLT